MTASEKSFLGLAKQVDKATPNATDGSYTYLLFSRGTAGVQPINVPLDPEVGGGALLRDLVKAGYTSMAALEFIPRPESLGHMLLGALGAETLTPGGAPETGYEHVFTLPAAAASQFDAPYYTVRYAPGGMWAEQFDTCRFSALSLAWRAAHFVRGQVALLGGKAQKMASSAWTTTAAPDKTPPFITPTAEVQLHDGAQLADIKTLSGSFTAGMQIPLEEQMLVGKYLPDDFDITSRTFALSLVLKITDATLYSKMTYDPAGGANWTANLMRESRINLSFKGNTPIPGTGDVDYSLKIEADGAAGGNVVWSAQPIGLRPGAQVLMAVTGLFLQNNTTPPVKITLHNGRSTAY
jgi:hypothetical protein